MSKPVTIRFVGDETKFKATTEAVGGRVKGFGKQVEEASEKTGKYTDRMGGLAERTDNSERNLIGLHDVIDGTAAIMAGPGEAGIAAYVQGWADLAGGVTPLIESVKNVSREMLANAAQAVKTGLAHVVQAARVVAAWVVMGVQATIQAGRMAAAWLISIGPVALVIAAIVGVAILIIRNWDKVRAATTAAFRAVLGAVRAAWDWIRGNWPLLLAILTGPIGLAVLAITRNWDRIRSGAVAAFNAVISFVRGIPGRISGALGDLGRLLYDAGRRIVQGLIDGIKSMIGSVGNAIGGVTGFIRDHLPFSPAKVGPLSGKGSPFLAGQNITRMIGEGMLSGRPSTGASLGSLLAPAAALGRSGATGGLSITVNARTNADAAEIAREVAWTMRTSGR